MTKPMTDEERRRRQRKVESLRVLAENITSLRNRVTRDLKSEDEKTRLTALAVAIMDKTAERVGNENSATNGHFGVTGFQCRHVEVEGNKIKFTYIGKSGVKQEKEISNSQIAKELKKCVDRCKKPEDSLLVTSDGFKIKADKVNRYLEKYGVTAKDIRGYAANQLVTKALKDLPVNEDEKERKKIFSKVLTKVAERVGHGKQTLRKHYLLPGIESEYITEGKIRHLKASLMRRNRIASKIAWSYLWATK